MIKSMTGFGKAETTIEERKISVEIRSLNSRQLDLSVRLPHCYRPYEAEIRALIGKQMMRGKVDVHINLDSAERKSNLEINRELFSVYYKSLKEIGAENNMAIETNEMHATLMSSILRLPDVVSSTQESIVSEEEGEQLMACVGEALVAIDEFRDNEGGELKKELLGRVRNIEELLVQVEPYEKQRIETIRNRIVEEIEKLNVQIDRNRFEQEMIYYVEKLDLTEERVRLANHCKYFREVATTEDGVGRKLNFISQEMGREINTLGSKANEATIQKIVVEMKDELEKIREQLLNIL